MFRRKQRDLDDEIQSHLAMAQRDRQERGQPPQDAAAAARREFGSVALVKEVTREFWGWGSFEKLAQDLRYAVRAMRRSPGFTAVAVLSLALGIGANTAIFSLIDALMLRALPVRDPQQLAELLIQSNPKSRYNAFSWPVYEDFRDHNHVFTDLITAPTDSFHAKLEGGEPERLEGEYVSGNFFRALGIQPAIGRLITPEEDRLGAASPVAVVSWSYWKSHANLDPSIVGRKIVLEDVPMTIVGVTPPEFFGLQIGRAVDTSVPLAMQPVIRAKSRSRRGADSKWMPLVGRLTPGVSMEQARAEMRLFFAPWLDEEGRLTKTYRRPKWTLEMEPAGAGLSRLRFQFSKPLAVLMAVVGMLLLIACANVAGMLLARGAARQRELAVRVSLGAGRLRLMRQSLTESVVLAGGAAALGVLFAWATGDSLVGILASGRLPLELQVRPDGRVLLFTAAVALLTGILFGMLPALRAFQSSPAPALRESGRGGETRSRRLFGKGLIAGQVALSLVLLSAAGLFVRNLVKLERTDLGFNRDKVLMVALDLSGSGYAGEKLSAAFQDLLRGLEAIPGVRNASLCWIAPISGGGTMLSPTRVEGASGALGSADINWVGPKYFQTMGIPLEAGHDFTFERRSGGSLSAIISRGMALDLFPGADPIGRHIEFGSGPSYEIVGVVGDARYMEIRERPPHTVYMNAFERDAPSSQFVIRTAISPASIVPEVRRLVRQQMQSVTVFKVLTLQQHVDASIVQDRLVALLSSLFGALGALLAAIGLYGLLAYMVMRRTSEIGIRMALGARRAEVTRMVLKEALAMVALGIAGGIPLAWWSGRLMSGVTADLPPQDWAPLIGGTVVMIWAGLLAAYFPALRASRVDPIVALRYE